MDPIGRFVSLRKLSRQKNPLEPQPVPGDKKERKKLSLQDGKR